MNLQYIHHNNPYYDHSDNWFQVHSGHLNNPHYNKMDTLVGRNVSECRCYCYYPDYHLLEKVTLMMVVMKMMSWWMLDRSLIYFHWFSLLIIHLVSGK